MNREMQSLSDLYHQNNNLTEEEERQLEEYLYAGTNEIGGQNYSSTNESSAEELGVPSDESDFDESDNEPLATIRFREYLQQQTQEVDEESEPQQECPAIEPNRGEKYVAQGSGNSTVWWSQSTASERRRTEHAKRGRIFSLPIARKQYANKLDVFKDTFPTNIVETIVIETNRKAKRVYNDRHRNADRSMRHWRDTNADEIYAYIAILLYAGAEKANLVQAKDLFDKQNMPFYRAVMPLYRFEQLTRFMRFDDSRTRVDRLRHDKLAPVRHIWTVFLSSIKMHYQPSKELCIDEQLLSTRNRCSFRQYIPSKPGKYGIKIFWLVDAKNNYPLVGEIYLGRQPNNTRSTGIAYDLVHRLATDFLHLGYNITMDNFFTSYKWANDFVEKDTTIVGTIRSNKPEFPKMFSSAEEAKKRGAFASVFCPADKLHYTFQKECPIAVVCTCH